MPYQACPLCRFHRPFSSEGNIVASIVIVTLHKDAATFLYQPSDAGIVILWTNWNNTMAVDALATCIAMRSAAMLSTLRSVNNIVCCEGGLMYATFKCRGITWRANLYFMFSQQNSARQDQSITILRRDLPTALIMSWKHFPVFT